MKKILISGAGIAGLALARQLERYGISFTIIEKREKLLPEGLGIALPPNAIKSLRYLGLENKIEKSIHKVKEIVFTDTNGCVLSRTSLLEPPLNKDYFGALNRSKLHDIFFEGLKTKIHLNTTIEKIEPRSDRVTVEFNSKTLKKEDFSAVVGADGINSGVRSIFFDREKVTKEFPYTSWRWISKYPNHNLQPNYMFGENDGFMAYPISANELYCYANMLDPEQVYYQSSSINTLKKVFSGYGAPAKEIIEKLSHADSILPARPRIVISPMFNIANRVCLVGDAGHATTPVLQQGAAIALEDIISLSEFIRLLPIEEALQSYEYFRSERVSWTMSSSSGSTKKIVNMSSDIFSKKIDDIRQNGPSNIQGWKKLFAMTDTLNELENFTKKKHDLFSKNEGII